MNRRERLQRDLLYSGGAAVLSLVSFLVIIALAVVQAVFHDVEKAAPATPPAITQSNEQVSPFGSALSAQAAHAAEVAAKQDDPPIPSF